MFSLKQITEMAFSALSPFFCLFLFYIFLALMVPAFLPPTQPQSIGHLVSLKDLWLDGNHLTEIPAVS